MTPADGDEGERTAEECSPELEGGLAGRLRGGRRLRRDGARFTLDARAERSVPRDADPVRVVGLDPIRVLVVGGDYSVGFGAPSRALALDGAVAQLVHERTGRGVIVENRSRDQVRLRDLAASLGHIGAYSFDLVIWTPTFGEAARYAGLRPWRDGVSCMLQRIEETSDAGVVLLGIPALLGGQPLARLARWRAAQIARVLADVAEGFERTRFVSPPPMRFHRIAEVSGPDVYRAAAEQAMPAVLDVLEKRPRVRREPASRRRETARCTGDLVV